MNPERRPKFLVFGNALLRQDSLPLRLLSRLRARFPEIEFKEFDPNENIESEGRNLNIIDTVEGIKKVTMITSIDRIQSPKIYSMHDFDLGYSLKLLKKLGYLDSVRIFGIPMGASEGKAFKQLEREIIASLSSESG